MPANPTRSTHVTPALPIALLVVGLGMVLIAGLAGTVLWLLTRRRPASTRVSQAELHAAAAATGEPAEA